MARRLTKIEAVCVDRLVFEINTINLNAITSVKELERNGRTAEIIIMLRHFSELCSLYLIVGVVSLTIAV